MTSNTVFGLLLFASALVAVAFVALGLFSLYHANGPQPVLIGIRYSLQDVIPEGDLAGVGADCMAIVWREGDVTVVLETFCGTPLPGFPLNAITETPLEVWP